ncbi:Cysteine-rich membrane protein 1 [Spironucleus salmonicida]|uniref:Cysteine-rich membrane protein 1 n=1 Tax=Spironucleus salmonicida TaxID=348837 RepID=V6LPC3_9EUKA|nr:Cysteine-rich membrane protein 1 [Spironucleus salmonicida]|eukprot:EST42574.1 Cysteine-rich membrane protein 1 [Spironucleus salmonicida]
MCTSDSFYLECKRSSANSVRTVEGKCTVECKGITDGNYCLDGTPTACSSNSSSECNCSGNGHCTQCDRDNTQCSNCLVNYMINDSGDCSNCANGYDELNGICLKIESQGGSTNFSGGAIAGIVIASLVVVGVIGGGLAYYFIKKLKR